MKLDLNHQTVFNGGLRCDDLTQQRHLLLVLTLFINIRVYLL